MSKRKPNSSNILLYNNFISFADALMWLGHIVLRILNWISVWQQLAFYGLPLILSLRGFCVDRMKKKNQVKPQVLYRPSVPSPIKRMSLVLSSFLTARWKLDVYLLPDSNGMKEERALSFSGEVNDQALEMNIVDRDKLLFSVFSLLQNLGADERPEVFIFSVELGFSFFEQISCYAITL